MIAIDLSKQQALDPDPRAIQQIIFTANLDRDRNTTMFFIIEEPKEIVLDFYQYKNDQIQQFKCKAIKLTA